MFNEHSKQVKRIQRNAVRDPQANGYIYNSSVRIQNKSLYPKPPPKPKSCLLGNIVMYSINISETQKRRSNHLPERPSASAVSRARVRLSRHFVNGLRWRRLWWRRSLTRDVGCVRVSCNKSVTDYSPHFNSSRRTYLICIFCTEGRPSWYENPVNVSECLISGLIAGVGMCP